MKSLKEVILGLCIGGGIILILSGFGAVREGQKWWPAYFIAGVIIAARFLKVAINDYKRGITAVQNN